MLSKLKWKKTFFRYKFTQNGEKMRWNGLLRTMESNQQAYELMKKARSNYTVECITSFAGGYLIGWPIGTAIFSDRDPNWTLAGVGAGLVAISVPFSLGVNKNARQAVELYNSSLSSTSFYDFKPVFKVIANENGIGLSMNF